MLYYLVVILKDKLFKDKLKLFLISPKGKRTKSGQTKHRKKRIDTICIYPLTIYLKF